MKATNIQLIHYRSAKQLSMNLEPDLTVLVGVNGAGKSTVLDALAIALSWATARVITPRGSGRRIGEIDIHNDKNFAWIELGCRPSEDHDEIISWRLTQTRKGRNPIMDPNDPLHGMTSLKSIRFWANPQRKRLSDPSVEASLPLFVYYPVNRAVLDIPLRIRKSHTFDLVEAYDNSLTSGANFRSFFEWYRNREDLENEQLRESRRLKEDSQLKAVRNAIGIFLPDFSSISVKRSPLRMEVMKGKQRIRVDQMSDGEKCLFAMVGDLSRRLAIANPTMSNPLNGTGIVLIDEIDLHLHPSWQRNIVSNLRNTFPNCQFIISTHSPQVFGEVDAQSIRILTVDTLHGLMATVPDQALGLDTSEILEEHMEASSRNQDVENALSKIFRLIDKEKFAAAKKGIAVLQSKLHGDIPELVRAQSLITMLEPEEGENNEGD